MLKVPVCFSNRIPLMAGLTLLLVSLGLVLGIGKESRSSVPFEVASVHFEQNATDGDVEVVFKVQGGNDGLAKLVVVSPDGRKVIDFTAPDATTLGIRQFSFESPEPADTNKLKAAYPEGVYTFEGVTSAGAKLHGKSTLNHQLPATASFLRPLPEAEGMDTENLEIRWTPVKNMAAYIIEIEQDELHVRVEAQLPGSATSFAVPDGFLLPDTEYDLSIGTVAHEGNISFVETSFTTAGKK